LQQYLLTRLSILRVFVVVCNHRNGLSVFEGTPAQQLVEGEDFPHVSHAQELFRLLGKTPLNASPPDFALRHLLYDRLRASRAAHEQTVEEDLDNPQAIYYSASAGGAQQLYEDGMEDTLALSQAPPNIVHLARVRLLLPPLPAQQSHAVQQNANPLLKTYPVDEQALALMFKTAALALKILAVSAGNAVG
jgi:hypothetical protein